MTANTPRQMAGSQFEVPSMIESMLDHLEHTPGALPLLQFAASQLWETRDRDRRLLTAESYHRIGGIASHADAVVAECTQRERAIARPLFLRLVTPERTRAIVPVSELYELSSDAGEVHRVVERLVRARLLVGQTIATSHSATSAGGTVEIVHESLISGWPLLRRWLDETRRDTAFLEQLRNASKHWQLKGYAPDLLWRGEAMQEAKLWHRRFRGELPDLQRAYLSAVFALAAKATRRKRLAVSAAIGFLSALVVVACIGLYMIRKAQQEATAQAHRIEGQLSLTQAAEQKAKAEHATALAANHELEGKNPELVGAIKAAEQARAESEAARTEAENARVEAEQARLRAEGSRRHEHRSRRRALKAARRPGRPRPRPSARARTWPPRWNGSKSGSASSRSRPAGSKSFRMSGSADQRRLRRPRHVKGARRT
jgi:hypothetical protein